MPQDTIVAISTPPGRSGIGIVRLSGPAARQIAEATLHLRQPLAHTAARFAEILDKADSSKKLDEAIVTWFAAPNSYTGEDIVEIAAHGSPVILEYLVRHALTHGARLARPGEFTEQAFLSGRIDLTQAEAVRDLIEAQTLVQARTAAEQMGGALSRRVAPVKEQLLSLIATLEAGVDFAEDDIDVLPSEAIAARISAIEQALQPIAASYTQGRLLHDGLKLAIVGRPNTGKSSLFNALIERDRAIVTAIAGTTRDTVSERVSIGGIPVELIDTAGLRETMDEAEAIGIAKTREAIAEADLVLIVLDATVSVTDMPGLKTTEAESILIDSLRDRPHLLVLNKIDLLSPELLIRLDSRELSSANEQTNWFAAFSLSPVSSLTSTGIGALRTQVLTKMQAGNPHDQSGMLTSVRHQTAVQGAQAGLSTAQAATLAKTPHEMLLLDLYSALEHLDSLTGATTADDILNRIFSTFCIGK
jgi:tRNA modification GTPase